jgi:hypothetical protein
MTVVKVDLEELYDALGGPDEAPARLLQRIVEFYGGKLILLVNVSTDVGTEVYYATDDEVRVRFERLVGEAFSKWDGSNTPECWEELEERLAKEFGAVIVELFDGYDFAIAVVGRRGEEDE